MPSAIHGIGIQTLRIIIILLRIYSYVFIADAILSWFLKPDNIIRKILIFMTEPLISLFRPLEKRLLRNSMFPISLAHLFAFLFLQIILIILSRIIMYL